MAVRLGICYQVVDGESRVLNFDVVDGAVEESPVVSVVGAGLAISGR